MNLLELFSKKNEAIGFIIGALASYSSLPRYLQFLFVVFSLALLLALVRFILITARDLREKHVPLLIIVGREEDEIAGTERLVAQAMEPYGFNPKTWDVLYNLELTDLTLFRRSNLPEQAKPWVQLTHQFARLISKVNGDHQLKGRRIYHLFLYTPSALAAGLGAVIGTKSCVVVHHYQNGRYYPVLDFEDERKTRGSGTRIMRSYVSPPYQCIQLTEPDVQSSCLMIIVQLSSAAHDPSPLVQEMAQSKGAAVACIRGKFNGVIDIEQDWIEIAREIVSSISYLITRPSTRQVELFLNCPVPVAFAVGMGLGFQSRVTIYNWFHANGAYSPVMSLNEIEEQFG